MTSEEIAAEQAAKAEAEAKAKAEKEAQEKALQNKDIREELEKTKQKNAHTEKERALYNLKKHAEKVKELGEDPASVLGVEGGASDEVPEWYKKEQAKTAQKTALQLADSITDEDMRALTREYLSSRIVPSGNPEDDFRLAFSAVSALKNKQILEDVQRRTSPRTTASGGSQSGQSEAPFEPTPSEAVLMKAPYNLKKEQIIEARKKSEKK